MLISTKWEESIRTDYERSKIPMRSKEAEYDYHGRLGFGIDIDSQIVVPTGLLKREPLLLKFAKESGDAENITDFDRLRIPFRAVATNIRDGEAVVLKSGSLAKAMYASSAIPGGLQPINIEGADLVDGGVSLNIPIEVAKEMGADVVIAVDVSENFAKELNVNSYFVVMGQLVDILMRKNADDSLALLGERDIRITPDLNGYGGLDTHRYKQIIQKGEEAAGKMIAKLFLLSLPKEEYARYLADRVVAKQKSEKFIDKIELLNHTTLNDQTILGHMLTKEGSLFSHAKI